MLMGPIENRKRILLPKLLSAGQPESHDVPSERLVGILGIGCIPVPLGIPMQDMVDLRNGIVLPIDKWQICGGVLNFAIAAIRQLRHYRQILWRHPAEHARHRFRSSTATPMHVHIARIPARRLWNGLSES